MRKCRYEDKPCIDRYYSSSKGYHCCKLDEWKQKSGVCPYDKSIHSRFKHREWMKNKISYREGEKNHKLAKYMEKKQGTAIIYENN